MKKTIIFILSAALLLSACSSRSQTDSQPLAKDTDMSVNATLAAMPTGAPLPLPTSQPADQPTTQPTVMPTQSVTPLPNANNPVPSTAPVTTNATAGIDNLNLRLGPGFSYHASRLLMQGQALKVLGRSNDGLWLEALLPDGSGGWVFTSYILTDLVVANLPIKEASGGAYPQATPRPVESITMTISGTAAAVKVNRFPANADILAKLGLPGETPSLVLATGKTDSDGQAVLSFVLPAKWADGSPLIQHNLVLLVSTRSGSFNQSAEILYLH
jgi:hypothetical protein